MCLKCERTTRSHPGLVGNTDGGLPRSVVGSKQIESGWPAVARSKAARVCGGFTLGRDTLVGGTVASSLGEFVSCAHRLAPTRRSRSQRPRRSTARRGVAARPRLRPLASGKLSLIRHGIWRRAVCGPRLRAERALRGPTGLDSGGRSGSPAARPARSNDEGSSREESLYALTHKTNRRHSLTRPLTVDSSVQLS